MRPSTVFVSAFGVLLAAGCPTRDQLSNIDGGGGIGIAIIFPSTTTYTNGLVAIEVSVMPPKAATISVVAGSMTLGTITPPETTFTWDTASVGEGSYQVTAQVTVNSKTVMSNPVTIVVDRTPPTVAPNGLSPTPLATDVAIAAPLSVTFSEPVLPATVTNAFVSVQAGQTPLSATVSLNADGTVATVKLARDPTLALPQTFTVTFGSGVTDLAGNAFVPPSSWGWTVPVWVKLAPFNSSSPPILAVGSNFHPTILYTVCVATMNGCGAHLHIAVNGGQGWNDLGEPSSDLTAAGASFTLNQQNNPVVSAPAQGSAGAQVRIYSWNGAAWDGASIAPIDVPNAAGYYVDATAIRLDSTGNPFVAYRANTPSSSDVYVARWTGSQWDSSFGGAGVPGTGTAGFDFLVDDQGQPIVATTVPVNGVTTWNNGTWTKRDLAGAQAPFAAIDAGGAPMMLTTQWRVTHFTGGAWLPTVPLPVVVGSSARFSHLTATPDRQPVVAWQEPTPSSGGVAVARWTGSQWDERGGLVNGSGTSSPSDSPPSVAVDPRGSIWLAWLEYQTSYVWMSNY